MNDTTPYNPLEDDDVFDAMLEQPSVSVRPAAAPEPAPVEPTIVEPEVVEPVVEEVPEHIPPSSNTIPLDQLPQNTQNLELIDGQYYHNGVHIPEDHPSHPILGDNPNAFKPGHKAVGAANPRFRSKANRVNVREVVGRLAREHNLDPIEVLYYVMVNNDACRAKLGFKSTDRVSPNLQAKAAMELLAYMAPKLKSVEVKSDTGGDGKARTHIFLPNNERNENAPLIHLPEKDGEGQTFQLDPQTASAIIDMHSLDEEDEFGGEE